VENKRKALVVCAGILWCCQQGPFSRAAAIAGKPDTEDDSRLVQIEMKNVNFRLARDIVMEVRKLRGQLKPNKPGVPVTFDDSDSFVVVVDSAEVAITPESLSALMNSYVLAYRGAPIRDVSVSFEGGRLIQKGTLHKGVGLPFEIEGSISTTGDGNVRVHAEKIKLAHVPVKGLLHLFGKDLANVVNQNAGRGMRLDGDDIILTTRTLTPPPHMVGRVTRVALAGGKIIEYFDSGRHDAALSPPFQAGAYIYHRGGILRFGKLTMADADLEIVGDRPGIFDFFQKEYLKQLTAGYSKTTAANGLVAHMVDYSHVSGGGKK